MLTLGRITLLPILRRADTATGTIRLYDPDLQYGLITPDDDSPDVFFHHTAIRPKRGTNLTTGDRVEYRATADAHRDVATTVRLLPTTKEPTTT
jgi:CspA family cold shock protein